MFGNGDIVYIYIYYMIYIYIYRIYNLTNYSLRVTGFIKPL